MGNQLDRMSRDEQDVDGSIDKQSERDAFLDKAKYGTYAMLIGIVAFICIVAPVFILPVLLIGGMAYEEHKKGRQKTSLPETQQPDAQHLTRAEDGDRPPVALPADDATLSPPSPDITPALPAQPSTGTDLNDRASLLATLERQAALPHVGTYASEALRQVDSAQQKKAQVMDLLSTHARETPPDLAQRFESAVGDGETAIGRNARLVASVCLTFEDGEYARLVEAIAGNAYLHDAVDDELQLRCFASYEEAIARLGDVVNDSERVLLEFDRLLAEVVAQLANPAAATSKQAVREMHELTLRLSDHSNQ